MRTINLQNVTAMPATPPASERSPGGTLYLIKEPHLGLNAGMMDVSGTRPVKLLRDVRLSGAMTLYQSTAGATVQGVYTIENFDSFTTYTVSISAGTAVLAGNQITVTSPTTPGDIYLKVNGEYSKITIKAPAVIAPSITYPVAGLQLGTSFTATGSGFVTSGPADTCASTEWQISTDPTFASGIVSSVEAGAIVSKAFTNQLSNTQYYLRYRFTGTTLGASGWSDTVPAYIALKGIGSNETAILRLATGISNAKFGSSMAFAEDGDYAVVGLMSGRGVSNLAGWFAGYRKTGATWVLEDSAVIPTATAADTIGAAVGIAEMGRSLVIGAKGNAVKGMNAGCVFTMVKNDLEWLPATALYGSDATAGDYFGKAVAITPSGSFMVVGAPGAQVGRGTAYVFAKVDGIWSQQAILAPNDGSSGDQFGTSVSISDDGSVAVVGSPMHTPDAKVTGAAYVYTRTGATWSFFGLLSTLTADANALMGSSVRISADGTEIFIAAPSQTNGGAVYRYEMLDGAWALKQTLSPLIPVASQAFGAALSINKVSTRMVIGTMCISSAGQFYVFEKANGQWAQAAKCIALVGEPGARLGSVLAITPDGDEVFAGAPNSLHQVSDGGEMYVFS